MVFFLLMMKGNGHLPTPISLAFCCDAADAASAACSVRIGRFLAAVPEAMMSSEFSGFLEIPILISYQASL